MAGPDQKGTESEGDGRERLVTLGRIGGAFGIRGWVKIHSETEPLENIFSYSPWLLRGRDRRWREYQPVDGKPHGKGLVARLDGCDDRDQAEALKGAEIAVPREQFDEDLAPGEFYWTDLEGMRVQTPDGQELGRIDHLMETGANDVMVVKGDRERLIPWLWEQVVKEVNTEERRVTVDWDPEF